jgi:hypothetical protein
MAKVADIEQGSQQWKDEKLGVISGTRAHDLMSSNTTRRTLTATLIRELVTADTKATHQTPAMRRGLDAEPEAASYYSVFYDETVTNQSAYLESDFSPMAACSPDGLVGEEGGVEFKRLDEVNHIKIMLGAPPEKKYVMQCHWAMFITGRSWWDLCFFCETLPDSMKLVTVRINRDDAIMRDMRERTNEVLLDVESFLVRHNLMGFL